MIVEPSQAVAFNFLNVGPDQKPAYASSTPVVTIYRNGAATALVVTVTMEPAIGVYRASFTLGAYSPGDLLSAYATADTYSNFIWGSVVDVLTSSRSSHSAADVRSEMDSTSSKLAEIALDADRIPAVPATESTAAAAQAAAEAVVSELNAAHGTGSWEGGAGAAGGGPVPLTVTVETSLGDPVVGAIIYILDSAGTPTSKWLPSDANGECVFGLAAGDYQVAIGSLAGYTTPAPAPVTLVADTAATEPVVVTRQTVDAPASAALCVIEDYVLNAAQQPVEGAVVTATASPDAILAATGVLTGVKAKATTDADGLFTLSLVRADALTAGSSYTIEIKHDAKSVFRKVVGPIPNAATGTLNNIEAGA